MSVYNKYSKRCSLQPHIPAYDQLSTVNWSLNQHRSNSISSCKSHDPSITSSFQLPALYDRYYSKSGRIRKFSSSTDRRGSNSSCLSVDSHRYSCGTPESYGGQWLRTTEGKLKSAVRLTRDGNVYRDGHATNTNPFYLQDGMFILHIKEYFYEL